VADDYAYENNPDKLHSERVRRTVYGLATEYRRQVGTVVSAGFWLLNALSIGVTGSEIFGGGSPGSTLNFVNSVVAFGFFSELVQGLDATRDDPIDLNDPTSSRRRLSNRFIMGPLSSAACYGVALLSGLNYAWGSLRGVGGEELTLLVQPSDVAGYVMRGLGYWLSARVLVARTTPALSKLFGRIGASGILGNVAVMAGSRILAFNDWSAWELGSNPIFDTFSLLWANKEDFVKMKVAQAMQDIMTHQSDSLGPKLFVAATVCAFRHVLVRAMSQVLPYRNQEAMSGCVWMDAAVISVMASAVAMWGSTSGSLEDNIGFAALPLYSGLNEVTTRAASFLVVSVGLGKTRLGLGLRDLVSDPSRSALAAARRAPQSFAGMLCYAAWGLSKATSRARY